MTDTMRAVRAWRTHQDMVKAHETEQLSNMRHWYASHLKLKRWGYDAYRKQNQAIILQLRTVGTLYRLGACPDDAG